MIDIAKLAADLKYVGMSGDYFGELFTDVLSELPGHEKYQAMAMIREAVREETIECGRGHGQQEVSEYGHGCGFAGGYIYWMTLACGCVDMDESDDMRAAF